MAGLPLHNRMPGLEQTTPHMPAVTTPRPIKIDANGMSNSSGAAGASLIGSTLADTSLASGLGGRLDILG